MLLPVSLVEYQRLPTTIIITITTAIYLLAVHIHLVDSLASRLGDPPLVQLTTLNDDHPIINRRETDQPTNQPTNNICLVHLVTTTNPTAQNVFHLHHPSPSVLDLGALRDLDVRHPGLPAGLRHGVRREPHGRAVGLLRRRGRGLLPQRLRRVLPGGRPDRRRPDLLPLRPRRPLGRRLLQRRGERHRYRHGGHARRHRERQRGCECRELVERC